MYYISPERGTLANIFWGGGVITGELAKLPMGIYSKYVAATANIWCLCTNLALRYV